MTNTRRNFLKSSLGAGASLALGASSLFEENKAPFPISRDFELKIYATNWGFEGDTMAFCRKAKESGYDGVEVWAPRGEKKVKDFMEAVEKHGLSYGFLAGNWGKTYEENLKAFQDYVDYALEMKPDFLNCHSGKDYFSFEQNQAFIEHFTSKWKGTLQITHQEFSLSVIYTLVAVPVSMQISSSISNRVIRWLCSPRKSAVSHPTVLRTRAQAIFRRTPGGFG